MGMLGTLRDGAIGVLLAPSCAVCAAILPAPSAGAVCAECWGRIPPAAGAFCASCGTALVTSSERGAAPACGCCDAGRTALAAVYALGEYDGTLRAVLHALKYGGRRSVAPRLSALMAHHARGLLAGADLAIPVPLHWTRRWHRGFNQSAELAAGLGLPVVHALRRRRATSSQTGLTAADRRANVRGAFAVRRPTALASRSIVLVDDVWTTGATMEACGRAVSACGAREVRGITAARVPRPRPAARPP